MTLELRYKGKTIISHSDTTWWITGFKPKYLNVRARNLTAIFTIDFSKNSTTLDMFDEFYNKYKKNEHWKFDLVNHCATYTFDYSN